MTTAKRGRRPAVSDGQLALDLFTRLLPEPSWSTWRTFVTALFGLPLTDAQAAIYRECTGRQQLPTRRANEGWLICGRRSGKTRVASALAVWAACVPRYRLAAGEKGVVLLLGADRRQASIAKAYIAAMLRSEPALARFVTNETKDTIALRVHGHDIIIEVGTSSYRLIRGRTLVAGILDELSFWPSDEHAAEPDTEALVAIRPALATTAGLLVALSSPHRQTGAMYAAFRALYGNDARPDALCWKAPTRVMNELIPEDVIRQARADDPSAAASEWDAEWRADLEDAFSVDAVEAVVARGVRERLPIAGSGYSAFYDAAGGSGQDSAALAIAHREPSGVAVLDVLREWRPPHSPSTVIGECVRELRRFGVTTVVGDAYAGEFPREQFRQHGIVYEVSARTRSELYGELIPLVNSANVQLLDDERLIRQLTTLERRTGRGRDSIDHRPGAHDDRAVVAAGALVARAMGKASWPITFTQCLLDARAAQACVLLGGRLTPYDPHCFKFCTGWRVASAAHIEHVQRGGELPLDTFIADHFANNDLTERWRYRRAVEQMEAALGL